MFTLKDAKKAQAEVWTPLQIGVKIFAENVGKYNNNNNNNKKQHTKSGEKRI